MNTIEDGAGIMSSRHPAIEAGALELPRDSRFYRLRPANLRTAFFAIGAVEFICLVAVTYLVANAYHVSGDGFGHAARYGAAALLIGIIEICVAASLGHFTHVAKQRRFRFAWSGVASVAMTFSFATALLFIFKLSENYSRGVLVLQLLSSFLVVVAVRLSTYNAFQTAAAQGVIRGQRVVLIGNRDAIATYAKQLRRSGGGVQIAFCPLALSGPTDKRGMIDAANTSAVVEQCRSMRPDSVILLIDKPLEDESIGSITSQLREIPADLYAVPTHGSKFWTVARPAEIGGIAAFGLSSRPLTALEQAIKRIFDIVAATAGLILLSPLLILAGLLVALTSPGPILFSQVRHGYNNRPIRVLKFRSMYMNDDEFRQAEKDDRRITAIGKLFRLTGIDELPQLWNILRGDMSVVGPRPHAIPHNDLFRPHIESYSRRHTVKPGLTGWAQVNGFRGETDTLEKMQKRIEYDLYYIDNWSLLLDLQIIVLTLISEKTYTNAR